MCGIAGFIDAGCPAALREKTVAKMCAAMVHRGPDGVGFETVGNATLGHRRLAIFDPTNGQQPMASPDRRFHVVFNGAIYNFRELRAELVSAGFSFRTQCDTEVLVAAYARWGNQCVSHLRGMFAFAVWDAQEATLFLARDPFGIKPLYYRHSGAQLLFASELNAFRSADAFPLEIDPNSVSAYLGWLAVPAPRTIYRSVFSLRPGECLMFRNNRCDAQVAWDFRSIPAGGEVCRSQNEFDAELRTRLEDTIRAHVIADVPVGAFLSGGLDSAVIVALMSRATGGRLKTFSVGFNEADFDESPRAAATAQYLGTEHHTQIVTGAEVAADLPAILLSMDQPTGDGVNTFYASQIARAGGIVAVLSGLGGDELFGGYPSFNDIPRLARWLPAWRKVPESLRRRVLRRLRGQNTRKRKLADILEHARSTDEICALQRRVLSGAEANDLLSLDARNAIGPQSIYHPELIALTESLGDADLFETISAWEFRTYMTDVLLRDSDVMSMRHSLELRVPFVDRPLIEWLWQQPSKFRHNRAQPKLALATAVADLLPSELATRRKHGFTLPFARWMHADLRPFLEQTFSRASLNRSGLFACESIQAVWQRYLAGEDSRQWSRVWSLAVLVDFVNQRPASVPNAQKIPSFAIASNGASPVSAGVTNVSPT